MTNNITQQIQQMQNNTNWAEAQKSKTEGTNNNLDQDMFLKLMLEQLKYQDPLNPTSNQDFLAQQAQFTQIEQLQQLNASMSVSNTLTQGVNLIGKEVTLTDPDTEKPVTGVVEQAVFYNNECAVLVNGKEYPVSTINSAKAANTTNTQQAEQISEMNSTLKTIASELPIISQLVGGNEYVNKELNK